MKLFTKSLLLTGMLFSATGVYARTGSGVLPNIQGMRTVSPEVIQTLERRMTTETNLYFIENKGQVKDQYGQLRPDIHFKLAGQGMDMFVGSGRIAYQWRTPSAGVEVGEWDMYRMDVTLLGANKNAAAVTEDRHPYYERYFLPGGSIDGVTAHTWKKITYREVYPHIDWVVYVRGGQVEYDFVVRPGGKVSDIRLKYDGTEDLKINKDGSLTAITPMGEVTEQAPYSFSADGRTVKSRFLLKDNVLGFATGAYTGTLIIDPTLTWSTMYGGSSPDYVYAAACDHEGNVYITGQTSSVSNIATSGSHWEMRWGGTSGFSAYLAKFDSTGVRLWGTYYGDGGNGSAYGRSLDVDPWGNVYMFGQTSISHVYNTIATPGSHQDTISMTTAATPAPSNDAFLVKFNGAGNRIWGTYYGGSGVEDGRGVACDKSGNVYICGYTNSPTTTLIASPGSHQDTLGNTGSGNDGFLAKFDSSGVRLWGTYYGGSAADQFWGVAVDPWGDIYMVGQSQSLAGVATAGTHRSTFITGATAADAVLVKFDSTGRRIWGTYYGGPLHDAGQNVSCDPAGSVYITGITQSLDSIATPGSYQPAHFNSNDAYLAKFDSAGQRVWGTYYGGQGGEQGNSVHCDIFGNVFLCGATSAPAGMATPGSTQDTISMNVAGTAASQDIYLAQFDTSGAMLWGTYYGGNQTEIGYATTTDRYGHVYLGGVTLSANTNLYVTPGAHQTTYGGGTHDGVLVQFLYCPELLQPQAISGVDTICARGSVTETYAVPPVDGATSYIWTLPPGWTGNSNTNSITAETGNSGGLISVVAANVCDTSIAQILYVQIYQTDTVLITVDGYTLGTTGTYSSYQWYREDGIIDGATGSEYLVTENDYYHVVVVDENGCVQTSAIYEVNNVGIEHHTGIADNIRIFPNPAGSTVYVSASVPVHVQISSPDGKVVLHHDGAGAIDIGHLPSGIYMLSVIDVHGRSLRSEKLVKTAHQ